MSWYQQNFTYPALLSTFCNVVFSKFIHECVLMVLPGMIARSYKFFDNVMFFLLDYGHWNHSETWTSYCSSGNKWGNGGEPVESYYPAK